MRWRSRGRLRRRERCHRFRVVVVGTPGHPRVDVDAFVRLYAP